MGSSFATSNYFKNFSDFIIIRQKYDNRFSSETYLLLSKSTGSKFYAIEILIDENLTKEYLEESLLINNRCDCLLKMKSFLLRRDDSFCTRVNKFYAIYDYVNEDLSQEISRRFKSKIDFRDTEILKLMNVLVKSMLHLEKFKRPHAALHTSSIFIETTNFELFMLDNMIIKKPSNAFADPQTNKDLYIAPENLDRNLKNVSISNIFLADVFITGLIIMETILKEKLSRIYDSINSIIHKKELEKLIEKAGKKVSSQIIEILSKMLTIDRLKRPNFTQINDMLKNVVLVQEINDEKIKLQIPNETFSFQKQKSAPNFILKSRHNTLSYLEHNSSNLDSETMIIEEKYIDGSVYQGQIFSGKKHGKGIFRYANGGAYDGDWFENRMHGYGILYYEDQSIAYEGRWFNDHFHGKGVLYNEKKSIEYERPDFDWSDFSQLENFWLRFEGNFNMDNKEGKGTLFLPNGDIFYGKFVKDNVEGEGKYVIKDGAIITGLWKDNKYIDFMEG